MKLNKNLHTIVIFSPNKVNNLDAINSNYRLYMHI
jgi:hypothetical protein